MRLHWGAFATSLLLALTAGAEVANNAVSDYGLLQWIDNTKGGFVHPHQEYRRDPETGVAGIFATKLIRKGEILMQVPWSIILKSDDPSEEGQMCCGTVKSLAREMRKGNASNYAPYVNFLLAQPDGEVPSAWSEHGQELFRALVGGESVREPEIPPEEPTEWLTLDWYGRCRGSRADKLAAKAALMVVQRSDDYYMIPGTVKDSKGGILCRFVILSLTLFIIKAYDMYNHRNGEYLNTEYTTYENEKHVTIASRDIQAGEQIHNSYNQCRECTGRHVGYGTGGEHDEFGVVDRSENILVDCFSH